MNCHPCNDECCAIREKSDPVAPDPRWFGPQKTIESEHAQLRCEGGRPLQINEQTVTILGRWAGILQQVSFRAPSCGVIRKPPCLNFTVPIL